jgi:uncharacterized protein YqgC (DUF456 family)
VSQSALDLLVGIALIVSVIGILVPILPGTVLAAAALLVWALLTGGAAAWGAFAVMALVLALGQVLKYLLPHKSMTAAGVPGRSIVVGGVAAIVGFFVIPVVGLIVGFIGGVYVAEHARLRQWEAARQSTWVAMKATGFSILIELAAVLVAAAIWVGAIVTIA